MGWIAADAPVERASPLEWVDRAVELVLGPWVYRCGESVDTAELMGWRIRERIEIHHLRHRELPERLEDVFGDEPVPTDPWGHAWTYRAPGGHGAFDLVSPGRDGLLRTSDDVRVSSD